MDWKRHVAQGYSDTATMYDGIAGQLYLNGLLRLLPFVRLEPYPAILDVGCGTGINLLAAARVFGPCRLLCGVDISPGMVAVAQAKAAAASIPAHIVVGDAEALPFPDQTFDLVIANSMFHWVPNRARAMAEFARVLRPGGQLLLACAAQPGFREWAAIVQHVLTAFIGPQAPAAMPNLPTPGEVATLLTQSGLQPIHFNHLVQPVRVFDPWPFTTLMATVAPHWTTNLDPVLKQAVIRAVAQTIGAIGRGRFVCTWGAVETVARRT